MSRYLRTTLGLMLGVGMGTLIIGVCSAWLVTLCSFPGRRIFEWALLLPMAMPAYVVAYVYTDVFEFAGPVQESLREVFGWKSSRDYWFPEIRSLGGAVFVMTITLYPYVYLLARVAFMQQSVCILEVSRTLGKSTWRSFFSVALPSARPALVVGVSLVLMEALNDFGTVDFFSVETLTAGIFDVWLNLNNLTGAAQLAIVALCFVLVLFVVGEKIAKQSKVLSHFNEISGTPPLPAAAHEGVGCNARVLVADCIGFPSSCVHPGSLCLVFLRGEHFASFLFHPFEQFVPGDA